MKGDTKGGIRVTSNDTDDTNGAVLLENPDLLGIVLHVTRRKKKASPVGLTRCHGACQISSNMVVASSLSDFSVTFFASRSALISA